MHYKPLLWNLNGFNSWFLSLLIEGKLRASFKYSNFIRARYKKLENLSQVSTNFILAKKYSNDMYFMKEITFSGYVLNYIPMSRLSIKSGRVYWKTWKFIWNKPYK